MSSGAAILKGPPNIVQVVEKGGEDVDFGAIYRYVYGEGGAGGGAGSGAT